MNSLRNFAPALTHWCFGITVLIGLVSSGFSGGETILGIFLAGCTSTLSAICSCTNSGTDLDKVKRKQLNNLMNFLIIWLDVLINLVAAATCSRLASATIDYISKGYFREILFGLQQHSLGEPWPDVLGVSIILVVSTLFMLGLEKSSAIAVLLFVVLLGYFASFTLIGSFHTVSSFEKWMKTFKTHSIRTVLKASAICSFAFVHKTPITTKNNCLRIGTTFFMPWLFYTVLAIVFNLMTRYRELEDTAIPLVQVFQNRDVDWARPVMAIFTICVGCLLLTEILPNVHFAFVHLAGREWKIFVSSLQYRSRSTGSPVLAIFASCSLASILAFACPLSHLIKLLNVATLLKCALTSCHLVYLRYKPDILYNDLQVYATSSVQYSQLNRNNNNQKPLTLIQRFRNLFTGKPQYFHKLSSPKIRTFPVAKKRIVLEEQEHLLFDDPKSHDHHEENSNSENEENEMDVMSCSDGNSSDTDIDVIVEEYREGLRVSAIGQFNERRPSTKLTSIIVTMCLILLIVAASSISLYMSHLIKFLWPDLIAIVGVVLIIAGLPENASDKSKPSLLPSFLFPFFHCSSIVLNTITASTIISTVWQGLVFWVIAGLLLYWRCDCCECDVFDPVIQVKVVPASLSEPQQDVYGSPNLIR